MQKVLVDSDDEQVRVSPPLHWLSCAWGISTNLMATIQLQLPVYRRRSRGREVEDATREGSMLDRGTSLKEEGTLPKRFIQKY